MMRGSRALVNLPSSGLVYAATGFRKFGRFRELNTSHRSSNCFLSVMANRLNTAASKFSMPGPNRKLRLDVPNVPSAGSEKTDVSKNFCTFAERSELLNVCATPVTSARSAPTPTRLRSVPADTLKGSPLCSVRMPLSCQPPNTARCQPLAPRKKGISHRNDVTKRRSTSKSAGPLSKLYLNGLAAWLPSPPPPSFDARSSTFDQVNEPSTENPAPNRRFQLACSEWYVELAIDSPLMMVVNPW